MILLWGHPGEAPLRDVRRELERRSAPLAFLDQRCTLRTSARLTVDGRVRGELTVDDHRLALDEVRATYLRPYDSSCVPAVRDAGAGSPSWMHAMSVEEVLLSWAEITPALVVNRPGDMAGNTSKPYQSRAIRELGFHTPETLVTTDAEAAFEFMARHGEVVYKSISGVRSVVSRLNERDRARLATELRWCPTQFQRYVPGTDYRVHVVGRRTFACSIRSAADDYRYAADASGLNMNACDLPQELTEACVRLAQALKLWVAGIDLRLSPEGEWVCFEVNPSPGFSFFADAAGQPIAAAIAELLIEGLASVPAL